MLKSVEFKGQSVSLGRLNVIVGQNGVGKSALLRAIGDSLKIGQSGSSWRLCGMVIHSKKAVERYQDVSTGCLIELIDNFSDGLHISTQVTKMKELQDWLDKNPTAQAVVVTYSPFQLETVKEDDVIIVARRGDAVKIKRLSEHPKLDKWRASLGTDELWANLGEDWVFDEID